MVGGDDIVAESLAELVRDALGETAGVDEDERRAVLAHMGSDLVQDVCHLLGARDRLELAVRQLDREVEVALVAGVDDLGQRPIADEQPGDRLDRPLRRGQTDPRRTGVAQRFEPFQREREMRPTLVARDGVDLVDDYGVDGAQRLPPARARHEQIQRFRCRHDEARRLPRHA